MKIKSFKVTGRGKFPLDMLRYDECWPRDTDSAAALATPENCEARLAPRTLHLTSSRVSGPTERRWASFDWTVGDCYDENHKPIHKFY